MNVLCLLIGASVGFLAALAMLINPIRNKLVVQYFEEVS